MSSCRKKIIRASVLLPPEHMDRSWKTHLHDAVERSFVGKCTAEHGYILKVLGIHKIVDQSITRIDGNIRFNLLIIVRILLPKVGDEINATIEMILPHGIFCFHKMMRMMLPISRCKPFFLRQDFSNLHLHDPTTGRTIRKNDTIKVTVADVRFENHLYSCIVDLKT